MRKLPVILILAAAISAVLPHTALGQTAQPSVSCPLEQPLPFDNYWVGPRFEGLYLVSAARVCAPETIPIGYMVEYDYENCSEHDIGCGRRIGVEIVSTPFSEGHRENISRFGKETRVGGVPGNITGSRLAVYLPEATVFISAGDNPYSSDEKDLWYRLGRALEKGPRAFIDLRAVGIRFPSDCGGVARCEGESFAMPSISTFRKSVNVLGVTMLILLFCLGPLLILRRQGSQPLFRVDRRLLRVAIILLAVGGLALHVLMRLSLVFLMPGVGAALVAFLVGGASLRPRGSSRRGVALGGLAYLMMGLVVHAVIGQSQSLAEFFDPERFGWTVLGWPAFPTVIFLGS
jgi:hypothetical protein